MFVSHVRPRERSASISFLDQEDAMSFFKHVKRHDLYMGGKRVVIRWSDRQFILPGHVGHQIGNGATRNLVILNCGSRLTEESIRADLEHIHNLVVVKMSVSDRHTYISLNSVHNAMFARTCMMSRSTYKNYKIEWSGDECAGPLVLQQQNGNRSQTQTPAAPTNRFEALNLQETSSSQAEEEFDTSGVSLDSKLLPTAELL